jgi:hypothetical protein
MFLREHAKVQKYTYIIVRNVNKSSSRLRENPDFTRVLKGRGFEPRRKCRIFTRGFLAAEVNRWREKQFFRSLLGIRS